MNRSNQDYKDRTGQGGYSNFEKNQKKENDNRQDNIRQQARVKTEEILRELEKYTDELFRNYAGNLDPKYELQRLSRLETLCAITRFSVKDMNDAFEGNVETGRLMAERIGQKVESTLSMSSEELISTASFKTGDVCKIKRDNGQIKEKWEVTDPEVDKNGEILMQNESGKILRPYPVIELRKINPEY